MGLLMASWRNTFLKPAAMGFVSGVIFSVSVVMNVGSKQHPLSSFDGILDHNGSSDSPRSDLPSLNELDSGITVSSAAAQLDSNQTLSDFLLNHIRVLCLILSQPESLKKAKAAKATWAQRCSRYIFISSANDTDLPAVDAGYPEGRNVLFGKVKFAFSYAYSMLDQFDWFMKADDDTYVIADNLRLLLSKYSPNDPQYFGCHFKAHTLQGYMSGGSGYVLSREATRRLVEQGIKGGICRRDEKGAEDAEIGKCLEKVGVKAMDSRDEFGVGRFFPSALRDHMEVGHMLDQRWWYPKYLKYPEKDGVECCSDTAVAFHHVDEKFMYIMEYLVYHLRPFGTTVKLTQKKLNELALHKDYSTNANIAL